MRTVNATEAARNFSEMLDSVEHRRESYIVTRGGKPVARILPLPTANGRAVKDLLLGYSGDPDWLDELTQLRASQPIQERRWTD